MEIKIADDKARKLDEFLGVTKERIAEITTGNMELYNEYTRNIFDPEVENPECILFLNLVERCKTWEEALVIAFTIDSLTSAVLDSRIEIIENFEKLSDGLQ